MRELNVPSYPKNMAEKRKRTYHFHSEWEEEYIFTAIKETRVSHLRGDCGDGKAPQFGETLFFFTTHESYNATYPPGSLLRAEKACELKAALGKQQSFFSRKPATNAHITFSDKKAFSDGEVFKEAMMIIANAVLKDEKNGTDLISSLYDVQLGASKMTRLESAMSANLAEQLNRDLTRCRWFSIQCDESVDNSCTAQLSVFIRMVFEVLSTKEELLALLPLKTTTRVVDVYNEGKEFFIQKKVTMEK